MIKNPLFLYSFLLDKKSIQPSVGTLDKQLTEITHVHSGTTENCALKNNPNSSMVFNQQT